jgi:predicted ABC-type ATPase
MSSDNKRVRIFAGPNGSGKTSLFEEFKTKYDPGPFINADLVEKILSEKGFINLDEFGIRPSDKAFNKFLQKSTLRKKAENEGLQIDLQFKDNIIVDVSRKIHSYEAALASAFIRNELLKSGRSFSFETVMSHPSKLKEITVANKNDYRTYLYFICTESSSINISRVENRVAKGGHGVPQEKIISRFNATLKQAARAAKLCNRVYFFDNSGKGNDLIAEIENGMLKEYYAESRLPEWYKKFIRKKLLEKI